MELIEKELDISAGCVEVQGYMVLLKAIELPEMTKGGIYLPDNVRSLNERSYNIGLVLGMGPEAYHHPDKFPFGPYCKVGDWVYYSKYQRDEENINGRLCYFIPDEKVLCKVRDLEAAVMELRDPTLKGNA